MPRGRRKAQSKKEDVPQVVSLKDNDSSAARRQSARLQNQHSTILSPNNGALNNFSLPLEEGNNGERDYNNGNLLRKGKRIHSNSTSSSSATNNDKSLGGNGSSASPSVTRGGVHERGYLKKRKMTAGGKKDESKENSIHEVDADDDDDGHDLNNSTSHSVVVTTKRKKSKRTLVPEEDNNVKRVSDIECTVKKMKLEEGDDEGDGKNSIDWSNWVSGFVEESDPLLSREWICSVRGKICKARDHRGFSFTVMSYNILSESLMLKSHNYAKLEKDFIGRKYRHVKFMEEIRTYQLDLLCLQEVDKTYFDSTLDSDLKAIGYESRLNTSIGLGHGLVLAFKKTTFTLISLDSYRATDINDCLRIPVDLRSMVQDYLNEPEVFQIAILKVLNQNNSFLGVINIHATYAKHLKPDLRCLELTNAIRQLQISARTKIHHEGSTGVPSFGWIICGDFNSQEDSGVYQIIKDGYPSNKTISQYMSLKNVCLGTGSNNNCKTSLMNLLWPAFQHSLPSSISTYKHILGREPPLTSHLATNSGCLDYIWCGSDGLKPLAILVPSCEYMSKKRDCLPDRVLPSDHLSLACRFAFAQ